MHGPVDECDTLLWMQHKIEQWLLGTRVHPRRLAALCVQGTVLEVHASQYECVFDGAWHRKHAPTHVNAFQNADCDFVN